MALFMKASSAGALAATGSLLLSASIAEAQTCGWEERAPMPTARYAHSSVTVDGKIYALGGSTSATTAEVMSAAVEVYDPTTDTWEAREPMPTSAIYFGVAAIGRRIYRVGGIELPDTSATLVDTLTAYDVDADTWTDLEPLPVAAGYLTATELDGKLYAVGGATMDEGGYGISTLVRRYDPTTNAWTEVAPLPSPRASHGAAAVGGKLYIVGGQEDTSGTTNKVSVYDPTTDTWSDVNSGVSQVLYPGVASFGGMLFVAGGAGTNDGAIVVSDDLLRFDPATSSWTHFQNISNPAPLAAATVVGNMLYVLGGANAVYEPIGTMEAISLVAKSGLLHRTLPEDPGANCTAGGTRLDTGFDTNCNGELDEGDALETVYLCHGEDGDSAHEVLVETTDEPAGDNCPNGGVRLDAGHDTDDDGELSSSEITKTTYVCHGDKGPSGPDGSAGVDGVDGRDGEVGAEGGCTMARGAGRDTSILALGLSALALFGLRRRNARA